ncbi:Pancreatic lipase-related protein [Frankliniella occidentalis]|nr:Pancreatic lipase-related protein [Frankliniella occidentalis]
MADLKDAVLKNVDGNVFIVDWGQGAMEANYLQAVSNTRIVGREIGHLGRVLTSHYGASAKNFHFMGHSLGAHISGYAARNITSVGRVTGAVRPRRSRVRGPAPRGTPQQVLGQLRGRAAHQRQARHVDFYMNGGVDQPGCSSPNITMPKSILDVVTIPLNALSELISCSHSRSYEYFTEALNNTSCLMWGHKTSTGRQRLLWRKSVPSPVTSRSTECTKGRCIPIGLDTPSYPARGAFSVKTGSAAPFCLEENSGDGQTLKELKRLGLLS